MAATNLPPVTTDAGDTTGATDTTDEVPVPHGIGFWLSAIAGAAIVAFGIRGLLIEEPRGAPSATRWFIGGALLLDLVVVPLGAALGWVAKRVVAAWAWPIVRAALFTSVVLIVFATPLVLDQGGVPGNSTVRPRNYDTGLSTSLAFVWVIAAVALLVRRFRPRASAGPPP